jgi:hypothetical protein
MKRHKALWVSLFLLAAISLFLPKPNPLPAQTVGLYYLRLQVELQTTAKRAAFAFEGADQILTSRLAEAQGPLSSQGWSLRRVWVRSAQAGTEVSARALFALSVEGQSAPLPFYLEKSEEGQTLFRISLIDKFGNSHLVQEGRHSPGSTRLDDSLDLGQNPAAQAAIPLSLLPLPGSNQVVLPQKMLLAFYYLWYGLEDWNSPTLQDRPLHPYASSDTAALSRHIDQAKEAGIQGFLASWWGPDNSIDRNFQTLLDTARDKDFKIALYFETMEAAGPRDEGTILSWLRYALGRYKDHPAFFKVKGRPVVAVWVSFAVPLETWDRVFNQLRAEGLEAIFIGAYDAAEPELGFLDVFDGLHVYNLLAIISRIEEVSDILARTYQETGRAVHYYPLLADSPSPKIWTATVQPGFDDTLLPGRHTPVLPRDDGALYQSAWQAATASRPDWIFITTWNEWWENTHIEAGELYGDQYLRLTWDLYRTWKTKAAGTPH